MSSLAWLAHGVPLILFFLFDGALPSAPLNLSAPQMCDHQKLSSGRNDCVDPQSVSRVAY